MLMMIKYSIGNMVNNGKFLKDFCTARNMTFHYFIVLFS